MHRHRGRPWKGRVRQCRSEGDERDDGAGGCGACTVLADDERILSCLALAVAYDGRRITTVEGLSDGDALHPLQRAFIEHDGLQCGYCTPGQLCSAIGMVAEAERGVPCHVSADSQEERVVLTREEIRERMSGNLCRCGAHNGIIAAIAATYVEDSQ